MLRLFDENGEAVIGYACFQVDGVLVSGPEGLPAFGEALSAIKSLYAWGSWKDTDFAQCGGRIRQHTSREIFVGQAECGFAIDPWLSPSGIGIIRMQS